MAIEKSRKLILVVDDDDFFATLVKGRLAKFNCEINVASNGNLAMAYLKDKKPDIIFLDIILPGESGFEILKKIKADKQLKDIPVVIISNLSQVSDVELGKELGAVDYITKHGSNYNDLLDKILREYLELQI